MAEAADALRIVYDDYNDVLRVFTTAEAVESIAVPGGDVTVLVSETLDRCVGLVFERYLPLIKRGLLSDEVPDEAAIKLSMTMLESIIPPLLRGCAPIAKDRVANWLEFVDRSRR